MQTTPTNRQIVRLYSPYRAPNFSLQRAEASEGRELGGRGAWGSSHTLNDRSRRLVVGCRGGSRYVEGCWGFPFVKIKTFLGFSGSWFLVSWFIGFKVSWFLGVKVYWDLGFIFSEIQ